MSLFDNIQENMMNTVLRIFGYTAQWNNGTGVLSAEVLFGEPMAKMQVDDVEFNPVKYRMEYKAGDLVGLLEKVRKGNLEIVTIKGVDYAVEKIEAKYDGKTLVAEMDKV